MERGQRSEFRGQGRHRRGGKGGEAGAEGRSAALSTPAQGRWMGREGGRGGTEQPNSLCAQRAQLQNSRCGVKVGWKSLGVMGKIGKMVEMGKMGGDLGFWDEVRGVGILGGRG